jgi:hypothetical protein
MLVNEPIPYQIYSNRKYDQNPESWFIQYSWKGGELSHIGAFVDKQQAMDSRRELGRILDTLNRRTACMELIQRKDLIPRRVFITRNEL